MKLNPIVKSVCLLSVVTLLSSCGAKSSSSASDGSQSSAPIAGAQITIDNAGVLPLTASSVTTAIPVHNNTNHTINYIEFNVNYTGNGTVTLNNQSQCQSIQPNETCMLSYTVTDSSINSKLAIPAQGSFLITAKYPNQNSGNTTGGSFSQVVNYQSINSQQDQYGVNSLGGVTLTGFGNKTAFGAIYIYGNNNKSVHTLSNITINTPGVSVVNGNFKGTQLAANAIQMIELQSNTPAAAFSTKLTIQSDGSSQVANVLSAVIPNINKAHIVIGQTPYVLVDNTANGSINIVNAGSTPAQGVTIAFADQRITIQINTCGDEIAPYSSCNISYLHPSNTSGSANLNVSYTVDGQIETKQSAINWYSIKGQQRIVNILVTPNPINLPDGSSESLTLHILNLGGQAIPGPINTSLVTNGSATFNITSNNCSDLENLEPGMACDINATLNSSGAETNKSFIFTLSGSDYKRSFVGNYTFTPNTPNLGFVGTINSMTTAADNVSFESQRVTITNNGSVAANLQGTNLTPSSTALGITNNSCQASLESNNTCAFDLNLGPTNVVESGTKTLTVSYNGGTVSAGMLTESVAYVVNPSSQNLQVTSIRAENDDSNGSGITSSPYQFYGYNNPSEQKVVITLENAGTREVTIRGINDSNSVQYWLQQPSSDDDCDISKVIPVGTTCTLTYVNQILANQATITPSASINDNIILPKVIYTDGINSNTFEQQLTRNAVPIVYVTNNQAVVTNTVTIADNGTANPQVIVTNQLSNAANYQPIIINVSIDNYFNQIIANTTGCSIDNNFTTARINYSCELNPLGSGNDIESATFGVNPVVPTGVNLDSSYSIFPSNQVVLYNLVANGGVITKP